MSNMRIDKFLSEMGIGSRREIKEYTKSGRITLNNALIKKSDIKINPETDVICFDNQEISYVKYEYYMLNKPAGVVSATEDKHHRTVIDLITDSKRNDLFPVGRLDKDTEGLLFLTNDGELSHRLLSPTKHVAKTYFAKIRGIITEEDVFQFHQGVQFDKDLLAKPAELKILHSGEVSEVQVTLAEGKFHQVKKMFHALGKEVIFLKRIEMAGIALDAGLEPGMYRKLTSEELEQLKNPPIWRPDFK